MSPRFCEWRASAVYLWLLCALLACGAEPTVVWQPAPGVPHAPALDPAAISDGWEGDDDDDDEEALHPTILELRQTAGDVEKLVVSPWVRDFVRATSKLPDIGKRTLHHDEAKTRYLTDAAHKALSPTEREGLVVQPIDSKDYYQTKYGSPLAYARALDLVAAAGMPSPKGQSVVDFGYGTIGHLRLLAALGARTIGIDVDPFLLALYATPGDQGAFSAGAVTLLHGPFPNDAKLVQAVGDGHMLWISKNVLKRGYIHPAQEVPKKQRIDLGVTDAQFVAHIARVVRKGGFAMLYNITPPPNGPGQKYRTWADGRSPFSRKLWESSGFEVIAFDQDDSAAVRAQGRALGWHKDVDLNTKIFAMYTLLRRN